MSYMSKALHSSITGMVNQDHRKDDQHFAPVIYRTATHGEEDAGRGTQRNFGRLKSRQPQKQERRAVSGRTLLIDRHTGDIEGVADANYRLW
jgi:hypothetical protein